MAAETLIRGKEPPQVIWATWDARYGYLLVHASQQEAEKEAARDREHIRVIPYSSES